MKRMVKNAMTKTWALEEERQMVLDLSVLVEVMSLPPECFDYCCFLMFTWNMILSSKIVFSLFFTISCLETICVLYHFMCHNRK